MQKTTRQKQQDRVQKQHRSLSVIFQKRKLAYSGGKLAQGFVGKEERESPGRERSQN
jgi:hypothetical protein